MIARLSTRTAFLLGLCLILGCSPVPRKYLREAAPNVTLESLTASPDTYRNRLVIMGAVIVEEEMREGALWLHVKNRPLDQDYRPQLPPSPDDPEAGPYWILVGNPRSFPGTRHHWADMTIVGRVVGLASGNEPVLKMVYVRGWALESTYAAVWEDSIDPNYIPSSLTGVLGEVGQ